MTVYFSTPVSVALTLLAAAMWGSWMQVIKHKKEYPIMGLTFWLYMFSLILVWGITLVIAPKVLPEGLFYTMAQHKEVMWEIMLGGAMMSVGMILSLTIMNQLGLMLATTLSGAITSILGVITSIYEEGLPDNQAALPLIVITVFIFLLAGYICSKASQMCAEDQMTDEEKAAAAGKPRNPVTTKALILIFVTSVLMNGWASGTATGTAAGLPPVLTCAFMATGSALSVLVVGGIVFTRKHQWKTVLCVGESKKPLFLGGIAAVCHYGGNVMSIYSMPAISATMSFLFGKTSSIWTYFWGVFYGEFKSARKKTIITLVTGLVLYFGGLGLLFVYNFS